MPLAEAARSPVHHIGPVVPGLSHQVSRVSELARVASLVRAACRQAILKHDWRVARQLRRVGNQAVVASLRSVDHDAAERVILAQSLSRVRRARSRVIALTTSKDLHRWLDLIAFIRVLVIALQRLGRQLASTVHCERVDPILFVHLSSLLLVRRSLELLRDGCACQPARARPSRVRGLYLGRSARIIALIVGLLVVMIRSSAGVRLKGVKGTVTLLL